MLHWSQDGFRNYINSIRKGNDRGNSDTIKVPKFCNKIHTCGFVCAKKLHYFFGGGGGLFKTPLLGIYPTLYTHMILTEQCVMPLMVIHMTHIPDSDMQMYV